jgi:hypothetical protein
MSMGDVRNSDCFYKLNTLIGKTAISWDIKEESGALVRVGCRISSRLSMVRHVLYKPLHCVDAAVRPVRADVSLAGSECMSMVDTSTKLPRAIDIGSQMCRSRVKGVANVSGRGQQRNGKSGTVCGPGQSVTKRNRFTLVPRPFSDRD